MTKRYQNLLSGLAALGLLASLTIWNLTPAHADEIDVSFLQTCLKEEGSSLDVLVLMDASASLRNARAGDPADYPKIGSDPERKRGKILKSSLKLLQTLAKESKRDMQINLRTFGKNSDPKELKNLEEHSVDWTKANDEDFESFIKKALYDDSSRTEWASALASAKNQFKKRIGEAVLNETKSCPIMFWITDGAPTDSTVPICSSNTNSSIDWFRENNILVLGGLLQPRDEINRTKASQFRPIVTGENCGNFQQGWTRGEVIEAKDIGDLAWGFVGLVASIKNLINLGGNNSSFFVDPGSSHIEIFIRGTQESWKIIGPDGSEFCSSSNLGNHCQVVPDSEIGIFTVKIFPENPAKSAGSWKISPSIPNENFKVYGSLNTTDPNSDGQQLKLIITPLSGTEVEEGKPANFNAKVVNADGSNFDITGFKNISICAKIASSENQLCKGGTNSADISVLPVTTDKSVGFEAILTSSYDDKRNYRLAASQQLNVIPSGVFPSLTCQGKNPCRFSSLKNKKDISQNILNVNAAKNGNNEGKISLIKFTILSDEIEKRGDGHFRFEAIKSNGEKLTWPTKDQFLRPGDEIKLSVGTDIAGDSEIQGVIKYKVYSGDQEIIRQLNFKFDIGSGSNKFIQFALLLLAYLITLGIPYAFLLWSARKSAVLNVPFNELAYINVPYEIGPDGKLIEVGNPASSTLNPDYRRLIVKEIEPNSRTIQIENLSIEVIPPKWNPFSQVHTIASVPGNYLFSTFGKNELTFTQVSFSSSVLDEAIFIFASEGNISASASSRQEIVEDDSGLGFLESSYETRLTEEVVSPTSPVKGNAFFFVSPYVNQDGQNKEQTLSALVQKIPPLLTNLEIAEKIKQLRAKSLEELKAKIEAEKNIGQKPEPSSDKSSKSDWTSTLDDEWGGSNSTSTSKNNLPDPKSNEESW